MADPSSSKSPTRYYGGPLSPGGGMVLDNTWINTELRKLVFPVSVLGGLLVFVAGLVVGGRRLGGTQPGSWGSRGGVFCGAVGMHNSALSVCVQLLKIVIWNPTASLWFLPLLNII